MSRPDTNSGVGLPRPIGRVSSPLKSIGDCPRQPDEEAPPAKLILDPVVKPATTGLAAGDRIIVLTWLHLADRDTLTNHPRGEPSRERRGVFATRSEDRPNPIGVHSTIVTRVEGVKIEVSSLEALDGTPILDIKPALEPIADR